MQDYHTIQQEIIQWFSLNAREFPWRYDSPEPYHVLISEYMLQQTQTSRIAIHFPVFLEQFPDIHALSKANNQDMIVAWQGLGYNNRALRLRDCAKAIVQLYGGIIPDDYEALVNLPGIGPYTASALLSFAFGKDIAVIDVNIRRIYSRMNGYAHSEEMPVATLKEFAEQMVPMGKSSEWHQAMMDIGAQWCKANTAFCESCPLQKHCVSAFQVRIEKKSNKRIEPSHRDIPNRIWRGRTIEFLRNSRNYENTIAVVLNGIMGNGIDNSDISWFNMIVLPALTKDRLIKHDTQSDIISLAHE
jgi:A/G-specific adenine glycosylase